MNLEQFLVWATVCKELHIVLSTIMVLGLYVLWQTYNKQKFLFMSGFFFCILVIDSFKLYTLN
jgi:hypothetical protein